MAFTNNHSSYISKSSSVISAAAVPCRSRGRLMPVAAIRPLRGIKAIALLSALLFSPMAFAGAAPNQGSLATWITDVIIVSPEQLDHIERGGVC